MKARFNRKHCTFITYCKGFVDGHIVKSARLNDQGVIQSAYVTSWMKSYDEWVSEQIKGLDNALKSVRQEATDLIAEEKVIRRKLLELMAKPDIPEEASIDDKREAKRREAEKEALESRHFDNVKRLSEIHEKIISREFTVRQELAQAASNLQARFATYAHGVLLKKSAVSPETLPEIGSSHNPFALYDECHQAQNVQIRKIIQEGDVV